MDKKETKTFELSLTPVSPCNLACEFCYQGGAMHDVPVESEGLRKFLEEPNINYVADTVNKLSEGYDDVIWNIFGGELLMAGIPHGQLDLYVEIMKTLQSKINKPLRACFLSNGVFTKHERIKEMLEKANGVIAFSYDPVGRYATPEQRKLFEATYEYFRKTGHLQQLSMTLSKPTMDSLVNGDSFFEKAIKDKTIIDCCYYCESPAKMAMKYQPTQEDLERFVMWAIEKKYYFIDNGLLNLFLQNPETSLLENLVAVELCRRYGKENVFYLNAEKEIDFVVPDEKLAIQVSYSIKDQTTWDREIPPLAKYASKNPDWQCLLITYDEEGTEDGINMIPVWKWLLLL